VLVYRWLFYRLCSSLTSHCTHTHTHTHTYAVLRCVRGTDSKNTADLSTAVQQLMDKPSNAARLSAYQVAMFHHHDVSNNFSVFSNCCRTFIKGRWQCNDVTVECRHKWLYHLLGTKDTLILIRVHEDIPNGRRNVIRTKERWRARERWRRKWLISFCSDDDDDDDDDS
jgi:hypothetical protein